MVEKWVKSSHLLFINFLISNCNYSSIVQWHYRDTTLTLHWHYSDTKWHYSDYSDTDLDLDRERCSELVTQLTITDKLRNLNRDIED